MLFTNVIFLSFELPSRHPFLKNKQTKLQGAYIVLYYNDLCSWLSSRVNNINNGLHSLSLYYRLGTVLSNFYTASLSETAMRKLH